MPATNPNVVGLISSGWSIGKTSTLPLLLRTVRGYLKANANEQIGDSGDCRTYSMVAVEPFQEEIVWVALVVSNLWASADIYCSCNNYLEEQDFPRRTVPVPTHRPGFSRPLDVLSRCVVLDPVSSWFVESSLKSKLFVALRRCPAKSSARCRTSLRC